MKSVLISIQPKWCELIANGKKTVEVRKSRPKLETPFKCYIYCTNSKSQYLRKIETSVKEMFITENRDVLGRTEKVRNLISSVASFCENGGYNGKVIGEFVCDKINCLDDDSLFFGLDEISDSQIEEYSCLSLDELFAYKKDKEFLYAWHISDLVIYDKPKELREFYRHDNTYDNAFGYAFEDRAKNVPLKRPPQSWCYVMRKEDEGK